MEKRLPGALGLVLFVSAGLARAAIFNIGCSGTAEDVIDLAAAIDFANDEMWFPGQDTLLLSPGCHYTLTTANNFWYGPNGLPPIESAIVIQGYGAVISRDPKLPLDTAHAFRMFYVSGGLDGELPAGILVLKNLTLSGGFAKGGDSKLGGGGAGMGGAIFNQGQLYLDAVTLSGNAAQGGNTHVGGSANGAGIGQDGGDLGMGGGFGGNLPGGPYGGLGDPVSNSSPSGGGGGFTADNGNAGPQGLGGGLGGLGGSSTPADYSDGGRGNGTGQINIAGGNFGQGGINGGGGGVGGGGGQAFFAGSGGFAGGGGSGTAPGRGGFGGGGGGGTPGGGAAGGFGAGAGLMDRGGGGAGMGGAIFNHTGVAELTNCTLTANWSNGGVTFDVDRSHDGSGLGAAIFNLNGGVTLYSSTIAQNMVGRSEGAPVSSGHGDGSVYSLAFGNKIQDGSPSSAQMTVVNSIVYGTTQISGASNNDVANIAVAGASTGSETNVATLTLAGANVIGASDNQGTLDPGSTTPITADPQLSPLASNDATNAPMTMAIGSTSPAIDAAIGSCPFADERGKARPSGAACDLGAYEFQADSIFANGFD
ncbi:MAG: choice-of-anchor Q domain-containing protein [Dokdonella sp.]